MSEDTINDSDFVSDEEEYDSLFGGQPLPSLFDKTHDVGTTREGVITEAPKKRQSRFMNGRLKFWGEDSKPTEDTRDAEGNPLKPCVDEVFVLQTDYRLNAAQLAKRDMDEEDDTGLRGVWASGTQLQAIRKAIRKARLKDRNAFVGMTLSLTRTGQIPKGEFEAWTWEAKLTPTDETKLAKLRADGVIKSASPFGDADS